MTNSDSIHSALREFLQPLKTNDARADFFAVYRRESEEFDKENTKKYDEDLNTSLIFVSLRLQRFRGSWPETEPIGWFVLGCQLSLRYRHPVQSGTRSKSAYRGLHASSPSHP